MKPLTFLSAASLLVLAACRVDAPTAADERAAVPSLAAGQGQSCYSVQGAISETGVFPNFAGTISGDLEGTTVTTASFEVKETGVVVHNPGQRVVTVTGGTVTDLIGRTLHENLRARLIDNAPPVIRLNITTRVDEGAQRGNLTEHGTLDLGVFPWQLETTYHGVVCP